MRKAALLFVFALAGCGASVDSSGSTSAAASSSDSAPALFAATPAGTCRYPIILEHGFAASNEPSSPWAFADVAADLMAQGHALVIADEVQPFGTASARAATMAATMATVVAQCNATPGCDPTGVHVIAHSFGGLHSREYLLQHPPANAASDGLPPVVSLTTISTPNYGTAVADLGLEAIQSGGVITTEAANLFAGLFGSTFTTSQLASDPDVAGALQDLSEANAPAFAAAHPAVDGVQYFAWAGVSANPSLLTNPLHPDQVTGGFPAECEGQVFANQDGSGVHDYATSAVLIPAHDVTGHEGSYANDGMSTVTSAQALPGATFMGCIPADHLAEVGHGSSSSGDWTGFDHTLFFRYIAAGLSQLEPPVAAAADGTDAGTTTTP